MSPDSLKKKSQEIEGVGCSDITAKFPRDITPSCHVALSKKKILRYTTILDGRGSLPTPPSYHTRSSTLKERDITDSKCIKKQNF